MCKTCSNLSVFDKIVTNRVGKIQMDLFYNLQILKHIYYTHHATLNIQGRVDDLTI